MDDPYVPRGLSSRATRMRRPNPGAARTKRATSAAVPRMDALGTKPLEAPGAPAAWNGRRGGQGERGAPPERDADCRFARGDAFSTRGSAVSGSGCPARDPLAGGRIGALRGRCCCRGMRGDITVVSNAAGASAADIGGAGAPNGSGIGAMSTIVEVDPAADNGPRRPGTTALTSSGGTSGIAHAGGSTRVIQSSSDSTSCSPANASLPPAGPPLDSLDTPVEDAGAGA
jgi:hypothetical protein